jgi:energy-coupling factor transport system ATP-binding protein
MNARPEEVLTDDAICDRAYLKRTSLYDLARKCEISEPYKFVAKFIDDEKRSREEKEGNKE